MTDEKKSLAYRLGYAYGTAKHYAKSGSDKVKEYQANRETQKEHKQIKNWESRERKLRFQEEELTIKEQEAKLKARQAKLNKSNTGGIGGIVSALGQAFGPAQSGKGNYAHSKSSRSMGPLIPDPLSNNPYGPPVKSAYKKHKKSKGKGKSSGQNIHIHIDK